MNEHLTLSIVQRLQDKLAQSIGQKFLETLYKDQLLVHTDNNDHDSASDNNTLSDSPLSTEQIVGSPEISKLKDPLTLKGFFPDYKSNPSLHVPSKNQDKAIVGSPDTFSDDLLTMRKSNDTSGLQNFSTPIHDKHVDFGGISPIGNSDPFVDITDIWLNFPRSLSYYPPLLSSLINASKFNHDFLLSLMLGWLPQKKMIHSDLKFDSLLKVVEDLEVDQKISFTEFASKIPYMKLSDQTQLDLVEMTVLQVVGDIIGLISSSSIDKNKQNDNDNENSTNQKLKNQKEILSQLCISILADTNSRSIDYQTWSILMRPVRSQWSHVLSIVSSKSMNFITNFISSQLPLLPQDIQINILQTFNINFNILSDIEIGGFLTAFTPQFLSKEKSIQLKLTQIDAMNAWIGVLDMREGGHIHDMIKHIYKVVDKAITKFEELENNGIRLLTTIISRSPVSFIEKHIDIMMTKYWNKGVWNIKKKDIYLECILRVLRGSYPYTPIFIDDPYHLFHFYDHQYILKYGPYHINQYMASNKSSNYDLLSSKSNDYRFSPYQYCGLIYHEEKYKQRFLSLVATLFPSKSSVLPKFNESYDILSEIIVQMASHDLEFTIDQILPLLLNGPTQYRIIYLRSLGKILSKNSGFMNNAYTLNKHSDEEISRLKKKCYDLLTSMISETISNYMNKKDSSSRVDSNTLYLLPRLYMDQNMVNFIKSYCSVTKNENLKLFGDRLNLYSYHSPKTYHKDNIHIIFDYFKDDTIFSFNNRVRYFYFNNDEDVLNFYREEFNRYHSMIDEKMRQIFDSFGLLYNRTMKDIDPLKEGTPKQSSNQSTPTSTSQSTTIKDPITRIFRKSYVFKKNKIHNSDKNASTELLKEALTYIHIFLPNEYKMFLKPSQQNFIGNILLHHDDEISSYCSYQLQQAIINVPYIRPMILNQMIKLIQQNFITIQYHSTDLTDINHCIYPLLSQLLLYIDIWNVILLPMNHSETKVYKENHHLYEEMIPSEKDIMDIESIALISLCLPNQIIRHVGVNILKSVHELKGIIQSFDESLYEIIMKQENRIIKKTMNKYILEYSNGIGINHKDKFMDEEVITIENIIKSNHHELISFVLSEIGYEIVKSKEKKRLLYLSSFLNQMLDVLKDQLKTYISSNECTCINSWSKFFELIHILRFSTIFNDEDDKHGVTNKEQLQSFKSFHENVFKYIPTYLKCLSSIEDRSFLNSLISSISKMNGSLIHDVIIYVWNYYLHSLSKSKKKNMALRMDISKIFRKISQHEMFKEAVSKSDRIVIIYLNFISEMRSFLHSKTPTIYIGQFFSDNALLLIHFLESISPDNMICCLNGPLRVYISPVHIKSKLKSLEDTSDDHNDENDVIYYKIKNEQSQNDSFVYSKKILKKLLSESTNVMNKAKVHWNDIVEVFIEWSPVGAKSINRKNIDESETLRLLNKIKNPTKRESMTKLYEYFIALIKKISLYALYHLSKYGFTIIHQNKSNNDIKKDLKFHVLDWVLLGEKEYGFKIMKYIVASNIESLNFFIDQCYHHKDNDIFIHSIYDQFLEDIDHYDDEDIHNDGSESTIQFFNMYHQRLKDRLREEKSSISKNDKSFIKTIVSFAGRLIFLVIFNLSNESKYICERSFDLLYRLGPIAFGFRNHLADYDLANRFQELKDLFSSNLEKMSRERALEVSSLVSSSCSRFTEDVFREAFLRYDNVSDSTKLWISQFLTRWVLNIRFIENTNQISSIYQHEEIQWKYYNSDTFLEKLYSKLTSGLSTSITRRSILLSLWTGLCNSKNNIYVIMDFLMERSIQSNEDNDHCKMVVLEIYKYDPEIVIDHFMNKMKIIIDDYINDRKNDKNEKKLSSSFSILSEMFIENMMPCLPYIHTIFNFILLNMNKDTIHLLQCILIQIKILLKEEDKRISRHLIKSNGILDNILTLLKYNHLKIQWHGDHSNHHSLLNLLFVQQYSRKKNYSFIGNSSNIGLLIGVNNDSMMNYLYSNSSNVISPKLFIEIIVLCMFILNQSDILEKWMNELNNQWIHIGFSSLHQITFSSKSLEIYRILLDILYQYSNIMKKQINNDSDDSDDEKEDDYLIKDDNDEGDNIKYTNIPLFQTIRKLRKTFQSSLVHFDKYLRVHDSFKNISNMNDKKKYDDIFKMSKIRINQLILLYQYISMIIKDENEFMEIIWIIISLLKLSPYYFPNIYEKGIILLKYLLSNKKFIKFISSNNNSSIYQKYIDRFKKRGYDGLLLFIIKGLKTLSFDDYECLNILIQLLDHHDDNNNKPQPSLLSFKYDLYYGSLNHHNISLLMTGLLPWINYRFNSFKHDLFKHNHHKWINQMITLIHHIMNELIDEIDNNNIQSLKDFTNVLLLKKSSDYDDIDHLIHLFKNISMDLMVHFINSNSSYIQSYCSILEFLLIDSSLSIRDHVIDISIDLFNRIESLKDDIDKDMIIDSFYPIMNDIISNHYHFNDFNSRRLLSLFSYYVHHQYNNSFIDELSLNRFKQLNESNQFLKPCIDYLSSFQRSSRSHTKYKTVKHRRKSGNEKLSPDGSSTIGKHSRQKSMGGSSLLKSIGSNESSSSIQNKKEIRNKSPIINDRDFDENRTRSRSSTTTSQTRVSKDKTSSTTSSVKSNISDEFFGYPFDESASSDDDSLLKEYDFVNLDMEDEEFEKLKALLIKDEFDDELETNDIKESILNQEMNVVDHIDDVMVDDIDDDDDDDEDDEMRELMLKEFDLDGIDFETFMNSSPSKSTNTSNDQVSYDYDDD